MNLPPGVRANLEAEECVVGLIMANRTVVPQLISDLSPADFYRPGYGAIFAAAVQLHESGSSVDIVSVADVLRGQGTLDELGGPAALLSMSVNVPAAASAPSWAGIIRREAAARRLNAALGEARNALTQSEDPVEVADGLEMAIRGLDRGGRLPERYWPSWADYSAAEHEGTGVPLIDGVCNQHTRIIILAGEKVGKSILVRQVAFCVAAGVHPFTFQPIEPVRVLVLDAENDDDELLPTSDVLRRVVASAPGAQLVEPALHSAPYGMDLRSRRDRSEFEQVLEDFRPQIIVGGPIYKLMPRREREDVDSHAAALFAYLDSVRKRWGCALLIEHHAPTGKPGEARDLRSKGGQQFAAWPEVTVALHAKKNDNGPDSAEVRFPHPPRGKFRWPKRFERGTRPGDWPWIPVLRSASDFAPAPTTEPLPMARSFDEPTPREEPPDYEEPF